MVKDIFTDMKNIKLTKQEKIFAEFFKNNIEQVFFMKAKDIAANLNTSDTSIIRFLKKMGYKNFTDFKKILRIEIENRVNSDDKFINNIKNLRLNSIESEFLNNINKNINEIFTKPNLKKIDDICNLLVNAEKKYIIGFKSAGGISNFLGTRLGFILPNVYFYNLESTEVINTIYDIQKNDVVLIFDFPIYSKFNQIIAKKSLEKGAKLIVISNSVHSSIYSLGNLSLKIDINGISFFNSIIPGQILVEYILCNLKPDIENEMKRFKEIKQLIKEKQF